MIRTGFKIRYFVRGPALLRRLKVRWLAIMDPLIEVQEIDLTYLELKTLSWGSGRRVDVFPMRYRLYHPKLPEVAAFLSGFKIAADDGSPFCLEVFIV